MILKKHSSAVEQSGNMRTKTFNIKASVKGFRIISTTLYSKPIEAIVRELVSNAWDAHQSAKNANQSIEVHLPTRFEPWFSVKDFGIGMDDDTIFNIYTTVFESTKEESNDSIGALGLGSKTPFSYNNGQSFTVISIKDGMKGTYTAYLDNGEPCLACLIDPTPTDEPNGVEVKVPVVENDFNKFINASKLILPYFSLPSVISNIEMPRLDFVDHGDYFVEKGGQVMLYAVMGNVRYAIDRNSISNYNELNGMVVGTINIKFPIGSLDFQASRESLHYDSDTVEIIKNKIDEVAQKIYTDAQLSSDSADYESIRECYIANNSLYSTMVAEKLTYKGESLVKWSQMITEPLGLRNTIVYYVGGSKRTAVKYIHEIYQESTNLRKYPIEIVIDDLKSGGVSIVSNYSRSKPSQRVYYNSEFKQTTRGILSTLDRLEDHEYVFINASELKDEFSNKKVVTERVKSQQKAVQMYKVTSDDIEEVSMTTDELKNNSYHYLTILRNDIEKKPFSGRYAQFYSGNLGAIRWMLDTKGIDAVYIIRRSKIKHTLNNKNATHLFSLNITKKELGFVNWVSKYIYDCTHYGHNYDYINKAWNNDEIRKHFKIGKDYDYSYTPLLEQLTITHPSVSGVLSDEYIKASEKIRSYEEDPMYKLAFMFISSTTSDTIAKELLDLITKGK